MQQLDDSTKSMSGGSKAERIDTKLFRLLTYRITNHIFTGKGLLEGQKTWSLILVHSRKKQEFLDKAKTGSVDQFHNYGIILATGLGDVPEDIRDKDVSELLSDNFLTVKLHKEDCNETFYVLCDPERKLEITKATSKEEIERHGKILYVANDADPPEVVSTIVLKAFYYGGVEIDLSVTSSHVEALKNGDIGKLKECLPDDVNSPDEKGWTVLHHAAFLGNKDVYTEEFFRSVPDKRFNAYAKDFICGRQPIHIAAREGNLHALKFLLSNAISVNEIDGNGWIPLHYAAWKGHMEAVKCLVGCFAFIDARDRCLGRKPLHIAADEGHTDVVDFLLKASEDPDENFDPVNDPDDGGRTPLHYAAGAGCLETARFLISKNANVHLAEAFLGLRPIHTAAFIDNRDMIELLLDGGSDIESKSHCGQTPLHIAAARGQLGNVKLLVDRKADLAAVDVDGKTPLDHAKDHPDVASYLADKMDSVPQSEGYGCVIL